MIAWESTKTKWWRCKFRKIELLTTLAIELRNWTIRLNSSRKRVKMLFKLWMEITLKKLKIFRKLLKRRSILKFRSIFNFNRNLSKSECFINRKWTSWRKNKENKSANWNLISNPSSKNLKIFILHQKIRRKEPQPYLIKGLSRLKMNRSSKLKKFKVKSTSSSWKPLLLFRNCLIVRLSSKKNIHGSLIKEMRKKAKIKKESFAVEKLKRKWKRQNRS